MAIDTFGFGINSTGQVIGGTLLLGTGIRTHVFVYANGQMFDLNDLIDPALGITLGINPFQAPFGDINDKGQIVTSGIGPNGTEHAYLLTPVPEPSGWLLCAGGLIAFTGIRVRGKCHRG